MSQVPGTEDCATAQRRVNSNSVSMLSCSQYSMHRVYRYQKVKSCRVAVDLLCILVPSDLPIVILVTCNWYKYLHHVAKFVQ